MIAVGVGAAMFRRFRWAFPIGVFAALPLRVPVQLGGQTSHLLVPLYLVIAGGLVCFAYRALAGAGRGRDGRPGERSPTRSLADWPAAAVAVPGAGSDPGAVRDPVRLLGGRLERDRERLLLPGPVRGDADAPRRGALDDGASWAGC